MSKYIDADGFVFDWNGRKKELIAEGSEKELAQRKLTRAIRMSHSDRQRNLENSVHAEHMRIINFCARNGIPTEPLLTLFRLMEREGAV